MEVCPYFGYEDIRALGSVVKSYPVCMGQKYMPIVECEGNPESDYCEPQRRVRALSEKDSGKVEWPLRAKWIGRSVYGVWCYECSACGEPKPPMGENLYCNGCGALMEEE